MTTSFASPGQPRGHAAPFGILLGDAESAGRLASPDHWRALIAELPPSTYALLAYRVRQLALAPPDDVRQVLANAAKAAAYGFLHRSGALARIHTTLRAASIEFAAVKGTALAYVAYPEPVTRPMSDIDLWIGGGKAADAAAALEREGWRVPFRGTHPDNPGAIGMIDPGKHVLVELHDAPRSITEHLPDFVDDIWQHRRPARLGRVDAAVLDTPDAMLHVMMHAAYGTFSADCRPVLDVALLVRADGESLDWPRLVDVYRARGVWRLMYVGLRLAVELFGAPVPAHVLAALEDVQGVQALEPVRVAMKTPLVRPPFGLESALARPNTNRVAVLADWLASSYLAPLRDDSRPLPDRLRRMGWRVQYDIRETLPRYVRAWRRGDLWNDVAARETAVRDSLALSAFLLADARGHSARASSSASTARNA